MTASRFAIGLATVLALGGCASNNVAYNSQANSRLTGSAQDHPPRLLYSEPPVFPPGPRIAGNDRWKLDIRVAFVVDETGAVTEPVILSSTDPFYDTLALECLRKWRFEPALKDGRPVRAKVIAPFQFKLQAP